MNELVTFTDKLVSNLVQNADGVWCMSSLAIAKLTGKEHKNVLRDIRTMLEELEIDQLRFELISQDAYKRPLKCFNLPKHECAVKLGDNYPPFLGTLRHYRERAQIQFTVRKMTTKKTGL